MNRKALIEQAILSGAIPHVEERGIPIVGRGPSVMPGTDPVRALLAKEAAQERKRRFVRAVDMSKVRLRNKRMRP